MIRLAVVMVGALTLAGCSGAPSGVAPGGVRVNLGTTGTCPDADPVRDGPLVDAIRRDDPRPPQAVLAVDPSDARAAAAVAIITGRGDVDPDQAACFAPYLTTG